MRQEERGLPHCEQLHLAGALWSSSRRISSSFARETREEEREEDARRQEDVKTGPRWKKAAEHCYGTGADYWPTKGMSGRRSRDNYIFRGSFFSFHYEIFLFFVRRVQYRFLSRSTLENTKAYHIVYQLEAWCDVIVANSLIITKCHKIFIFNTIIILISSQVKFTIIFTNLSIYLSSTTVYLSNCEKIPIT